MKTLFRIFLVLFVLLVIAAGVGYFIVTRPAFQKKLVESKLPEGSSIQFVHITTGSVQLTDLQLRLPDGTTAKLDSLRSDFSPLAALFSSTIRMRGLTVEGLVVELPETAAATAPTAPTGTTPAGQTPSGTTAPESPKTPAAEPGSPTDALYALGEIDWLFDLDSIDLNGALIDAARNRYVFDVTSSQIAPGVETTLTTTLKLESKEALQGGLQDFNADARLIFTQQASGGFERLRLESLTEGSDASGGKLLSISQTLELAVNSLEKTALVDLSFNADLSRPEVFAPELAALQGLSLQGELKASAEGAALTVQAADFKAASNGAPVATVKLKQSLTLGAEQQFAGELMEVALSNLPLAWINPWLGDGLRLSGAPLSTQITVSGEPGGALQVRTPAPIQFGPFSLAQHAQTLLQEVTLRMNPVVRVEADQTIRFDLGELQLLDRGGALISGAVSGSKQDLVVNNIEKAEFSLNFNADLSRPEVFSPELAALQGLSLQGELKASAEGDTLTVQAADFEAASNGAPVATVKLKQSLTLGAEQQFAGELMEVALSNLPLAWVNPWLGDGLRLSGAPLSTQIAVSGEPGGALQVRTLAPIQFGPFSLAQHAQALLQEVTLRMNPVIRVEADQTIRYDLGDFQLLDRYGAFVSGTLSGSKQAAAGDSPLAGLQTKARLDLGLAELLQQPVLDGKASVMAGQAKVQLDIDGAAEYPAKLQAAVTGLRARDLPGSQQDFRLAAQLKQTAGGYALGSNFSAGSESRPSTNVQLAGQVNLDAQPIPFKVDLTAPRITQSDLDLLMAAAQPRAAAPTPATPSSPSDRAGSPPARAPSAGAPAPTPPPWADLNGQVAIRVDELIMPSGQVITGLKAQAKISEALLAVSDIAASLEGGSLGGAGQVAYDPVRGVQAYRVSSAISFQDVDPAIFSKKASGSFPVKGLFDGSFNLTGGGATLEAALEDSEADLLITGRDGVLTAFELDERSQLGLLGAGILGQSLDRPGITAMAQAVPYFKNMRFDNFTLKLVRGQDKQVRIPELSFLGDNLRLNGQGFIAASSLGEVLDQPLDLTLGLGAKGRLVDYLETLQLLQPATAEDGFRNWNKAINIGGTLGAPDTSALKEILSNAARRALSEPKKSPPATKPEDAQTPPAEGEMRLPGQETTPPPPAEEPRKKTKEEKRKDDIEQGIDLINSIFG